ncbi:MAG: VOC family protein [Amphiplicatus sp.]
MTDSAPASAVAIAPYLLVADIRRSVDWYTDKIGFSADRLWGEPPVFTIAKLGGVSLMLKQSPDAPSVATQREDDAWNAYIWVRDIKAIEERLRGKGVPFRRGPEKTDYGCVEIEIADPDGHVLCFGEA